MFMCTLMSFGSRIRDENTLDWDLLFVLGMCVIAIKRFLVLVGTGADSREFFLA